MTSRFDKFNSEEKSLIMLGLCKVRLPEDSSEKVTLTKLLDEVTK